MKINKFKVYAAIVSIFIPTLVYVVIVALHTPEVGIIIGMLAIIFIVIWKLYMYMITKYAIDGIIPLKADAADITELLGCLETRLDDLKLNLEDPNRPLLLQYYQKRIAHIERLIAQMYYLRNSLQPAVQEITHE